MDSFKADGGVLSHEQPVSSFLSLPVGWEKLWGPTVRHECKIPYHGRMEINIIDFAASCLRIRGPPQFRQEKLYALQEGR
ncbi:uncharacterized [Tachysurus ichikawai]